MVMAKEKVNSEKPAASEKVDGAEKIERAKETGIRFVQLQFTDIIGHVKAVTIPIHQLEGSVRHGTWFDGSSRLTSWRRPSSTSTSSRPERATPGSSSGSRRSWRS